MRKQVIVAAAAMLAAVPAAALDAEQALKAAETRQAVLKLAGWNAAPLGAMTRGLVPFDSALFARNAQRIAWVTTMIPDAFRADTRAHPLETEALPVIWEEFARFEELAGNVQRSARQLAEVAAGGDEGAIKRAFTAMTDDCKACHERFREKKD